jgi:hypothetical protein
LKTSWGTGPCRSRRSLARRGAQLDALEKLGQRQLGQRIDDDIRLVERQRRRDLVRNGDTDKAGGLRRENAVAGILERDRLARLERQSFERLEVERRLRLRTRVVAIGGDDRVQSFQPAEPMQVSFDPPLLARRDDSGAKAPPFGLDEVLLYAWPQLLEIAECAGAIAHAAAEIVTVDRLAEQLF